VDFETGLVAAKEFGELVRSEAPQGTTSAQAAIAWLWQHAAVSSVIPGARNVEQARANAAAGRVPELGAGFDEGVRRIYDEHLRAAIHPRW
jgi:aryl-alcohol dehydrogenase-like predicted oxidoreductase